MSEEWAAERWGAKKQMAFQLTEFRLPEKKKKEDDGWKGSAGFAKSVNDFVKKSRERKTDKEIKKRKTDWEKEGAVETEYS